MSLRQRMTPNDEWGERAGVVTGVPPNKELQRTSHGWDGGLAAELRVRRTDSDRRGGRPVKRLHGEQGSPDAVCASHAELGVQITCKIIDGNAVLLEGPAEALTFLGELLIAQAEFTKDCGFQLQPHGPGGKLFSSQSDHGIYIHRVPCGHGKEGE